MTNDVACSLDDVETDQKPKPPPECLDETSNPLTPAKNMFDHLDETPTKKGLSKSMFRLPYDLEFPHEWQEESEGCGAAANSMVYRALGHPVPQKDIFKAVVIPDGCGGRTCSDWLLYLDALVRGFHALHVRAINPIEMLNDCYEHSIKVTVHQRAGPNSLTGHATVLTGIDDKFVYLHCSALGPRQYYSHNEVLERMSPIGISDIHLGNSLTLISNPITEKYTCKECDKEMPEFFPCPNCGKQFRLSPCEPLGCIDSECGGHKWIDIECPYCFQGIRRIEDRTEDMISAEEWPKVLKERQDEIKERENRFKNMFKFAKLNQPPGKTNWLK